MPESGDIVTVTKLFLKTKQLSRPQYQVAAAAGIHHSTMSEYCRGVRPFSAKHLESLCDLFDCEPDDLIGTVEVQIA